MHPLVISCQFLLFNKLKIGKNTGQEKQPQLHKNELENLKKSGKTFNPNDPCHKRIAKNKQKIKQSDKTQKSNDEDAICLYCNDVNHSFLTSSEPWVACQPSV
ncbi:unnamed protein product [Parnassius apollo]|uniref:(apollo) hypothetical protein n=1 Tax=Parnassius apollo TaxID=110799 RepID=A0A8S3X8A0_PARAO|nr:unnamed protein product [Parnassius apollo]